LASLLDKGITYKGNEDLDFIPIGFNNANWGQDKTTKYFVLGFVFMLNGGSILWKLKLQVTVLLLTC